MATEKDELAKRITELEVRLTDSESKLVESELRVAKEREADKELEEELLLYKKEVVEQHEKGFEKAVRQGSLFAKDLDLGQDVKDDILLDEEVIATKEEEEAADEGQGVTEQGDDPIV